MFKPGEEVNVKLPNGYSTTGVIVRGYKNGSYMVKEVVRNNGKVGRGPNGSLRCYVRYPSNLSRK